MPPILQLEGYMSPCKGFCQQHCELLQHPLPWTLDLHNHASAGSGHQINQREQRTILRLTRTKRWIQVCYLPNPSIYTTHPPYHSLRAQTVLPWLSHRCTPVRPRCLPAIDDYTICRVPTAFSLLLHQLMEIWLLALQAGARAEPERVPS